MLTLRSIAAALFLLGAILSPNLAARAAAYIKLGDIKGEVVEADHVDWSGIDSLSMSVRRPPGTDATGAAPRTTSEFVISKPIDRGSPTILERLANGKPLATVEIHLTRTLADGSKATYLKYELKNVLITSYSAGGASDSNAAPSEQLSLNYEEIRITYLRLDPRSGRVTEEIPGVIRIDPIKQ